MTTLNTYCEGLTYVLQQTQVRSILFSFLIYSLLINSNNKKASRYGCWCRSNKTRLLPCFFFFFFTRRYKPRWVLACFTISFHNLPSSHFSLQFLTFIFFKSSSIWSSHLNLGLPTGLDEHGSHAVNFLTVLVTLLLFNMSKGL